MKKSGFLATATASGLLAFALTGCQPAEEKKVEAPAAPEQPVSMEQPAMPEHPVSVEATEAATDAEQPAPAPATENPAEAKPKDHPAH